MSGKWATVDQSEVREVAQARAREMAGARPDSRFRVVRARGVWYVQVRVA